MGPEFVKPAAPLNADWSNADKSQFAARAAADTAWWKTYNDPVLDSLIATAYQQNLSLQAAGIRIYEARAQLGIAIGR